MTVSEKSRTFKVFVAGSEVSSLKANFPIRSLSTTENFPATILNPERAVCSCHLTASVGEELREKREKSVLKNQQVGS